MACEFQGEKRETAPVWDSVSAWDAPAVSKEERDPSHMVQSMDLPYSKMRMGMDLIVILNERQQKKWAFERESNAADAALAHRWEFY